MSCFKSLIGGIALKMAPEEKSELYNLCKGEMWLTYN